jgi:hypothetical protein
MRLISTGVPPCVLQTNFIIFAERNTFIRGLIDFRMRTEQAQAGRDHSRLREIFVSPQISCAMEAGLGDVVNLKRFRKRADRALTAKKAEANRARFGRTKSERALDQQRAERASDLLDQHRIDGEDAS